MQTSYKTGYPTITIKNFQKIKGSLNGDYMKDYMKVTFEQAMKLLVKLWMGLNDRCKERSILLLVVEDNKYIVTVLGNREKILSAIKEIALKKKISWRNKL